MAKHYYISFNGADYSEIFPDNNPVGVERQLEGTRVWREEVDEIKLTKTTNATVYDTLHSYFIDKTKFDVEIYIEIYSGQRKITNNVYTNLSQTNFTNLETFDDETKGGALPVYYEDTDSTIIFARVTNQLQQNEVAYQLYTASQNIETEL